MAKHIVHLVAILAAGWMANANAQDACARLALLKLPDTTITVARTIVADTFEFRAFAPGMAESTVALPAHCRVTGSIRPTEDSDIRFEVWIPVSGWDHRYVQVGNGGLAGSIIRGGLAFELLRGSATAATDDGHESGQDGGFDGTWALGHPEKLVDYGYRAVHLTALDAEAIIEAYYGQAARHTYFSGCSDGGRESLMEAQRYPQDFQGYLVGAPGIDIPNNELIHLHVWQVLHGLGPNHQLTSVQLRTLSAAVLKRCDALDGVKDGVLRDPRRCDFKARELICGPHRRAGCLTAAQSAAVQEIYDGPRDAPTGKPLAPEAWGTMGTEAVTWPGIFLPRQNRPSLGSVANEGVIGALLYGNPKLDMATVDLTRAARDMKRKLDPVINSDSSDLRVAR